MQIYAINEVYAGLNHISQNQIKSMGVWFLCGSRTCSANSFPHTHSSIGHANVCLHSFFAIQCSPRIRPIYISHRYNGTESIVIANITKFINICSNANTHHPSLFSPIPLFCYCIRWILMQSLLIFASGILHHRLML